MAKPGGQGRCWSHCPSTAETQLGNGGSRWTPEQRGLGQPREAPLCPKALLCLDTVPCGPRPRHPLAGKSHARQSQVPGDGRQRAHPGSLGASGIPRTCPPHSCPTPAHTSSPWELEPQPGSPGYRQWVLGGSRTLLVARVTLGFVQPTDEGLSNMASTRWWCGLALLPSGSRRSLDKGRFQHQGHPAGSGTNI